MRTHTSSKKKSPPLSLLRRAHLPPAARIVKKNLLAERPVTAVQKRKYLATSLARNTIERRGVEAAIWGMPMVSVYAMRQAFLHDADAKYGDFVFWSRPSDWKNQTTTPNASSLYVYFNYQLKDEPWVLEFPAAVGAGLFGSILDAWQVPMVEVGPEGEDHGKGGKYLLLPPGFTGDAPSGYIPVRSATYNGYGLFRAIPKTQNGEDIAKALDLVKHLRLYPCSKADDPPHQRHVDMVGKLYDGIVRFDETFYDALARMVNEEPVQSHDRVVMGQLRSLGIEKGKEFKTDDATKAILRRTAAEAHALFMHENTKLNRFWPDARWGLAVSNGPKTGFTFQTEDFLDVDERAAVYFLAYAPPKKLGAATFYLGAVHDAAGAPLDGAKFYRLRVPPNVPAKQFWSVTVYDSETCGFFRESPKVSVDSYQTLQKNADGSVDVYFGPAAPPNKESNWIHTARGKQWFSFFRCYGPDKSLFDKTWSLPDIEKTK